MAKRNSQKHLQRSLIPDSSIPGKKSHYLNDEVISFLDSDGNESKVFVSLLLVQFKYQCFSAWNKEELKRFWNFQTKLSETSWQQVLQSGGKGPKKSGFGYTPLPKYKYPGKEFIKRLSPETTLFELRVSGAIRVHGFRVKSVFYICWLDRNHEICP